MAQKEPLIRLITDGVIVHWHGRSWELMRKPVRWHTCTADTFAIIWRHQGVPNFVQRCRCGARRSAYFGELFGEWLDRNARRRNKVEYVLPNS